MRSKRYQTAAKTIDPQKSYTLTDGFGLLEAIPKTRFDQSVELHIRLGIDPKKSDQMVRGGVVLPHGTGKTKRIAVFTTPAHQAAATKAGANLVGGDELVAKIKETGKCDFDIALATPDFMKNMASIAKVLGPKGLMPTPKNNTITNDIPKAIEELQRGKVTFKNDDTGNLHAPVGKLSWGKEKILTNAKALLDAVSKAKPASAKGVFLKRITLTSTMGPAIRISL